MMWTRCLLFINICTYFWDRASKPLLCEFTILFWQKYFLSKKNQSMFSWSGWLSLFKSLAEQSLLLSFIACDKNWPFFILYENYQMSSCINCLRHSHIPGSELDWLAWIVIYQGLDPTNKIRSSFLIKTIRTFELPYLCNHHWTYPTFFEFFGLSLGCPHPNKMKSL